MSATTQFSLTRDVSGAMAWWQEAGVDCAFADEPRIWLAEVEPATGVQQGLPRPAPIKIPEPVAESPRIGGAAEHWPQDLAAFTAWWMTEPSLDNGRNEGRVPPRGSVGAKLMLLVEQPEESDSESLLSGPQGAWLNLMLSAMGISPEDVYFASALTRATPMADWSAMGVAGLADLTRHHVHLAAPQRVLALGGNILSLLGHDPAQSPQILTAFDHEGATIPALGAQGAEMLARPGAKARLWQAYLNFTGGNAA